MGILGWIVVGLIAGGFARAITGGAPDAGCLVTMVIGIIGGVLGGWLFSLAGDEGIGDFGLRSMFVALIGAIVLLLIVALFTGGHFGRRRRY